MKSIGLSCHQIYRHPKFTISNQQCIIDFIQNSQRHLRLFKIKTILTIARELNFSYNQKSIEFHKQYKVYDEENFQINQYFDDTYLEIENGFLRGSILVHCYGGISRSPTIVIAYMMKKEKMNFEEAFSYVKDRRDMIKPNPGFILQLQSFQEK